MEKLLKLIRNKYRAFTLIETMITLAICCGMMLIGSLQLKKYQNRLVFDNTVKEVTAALDQASRISTIEGHGVTVIFSENQHYIELVGGGHEKHVNINENIDIKGLTNFVFSKTGRSAPRTVTISGYGMKKAIKYQMLWGRMAK